MTNETVPYKLLDLIHRTGGIELNKASKILKLDVKYVLEMAKILSEPQIIEIFYAVSGDTLLRPGKEFKRAFEEKETFDSFSLRVKKAERKIPEDRRYVEEFLGSIRKRIVEKKRGEEKQ